MNIAIVDDHKIVAEFLKNKLKDFEIINTVSIFNSGEALITSINDRIDLIFLDVLIPEMDGIELIKKCREKFSEEQLKIIMLSSCKKYTIIKDAIKSGANGYITKEDTSNEIYNVLQYFLTKGEEKQPYFSENVSKILLSNVFLEKDSIKLSKREKELLDLICKARTAKEIAFDLGLSVNTIHYYTKRLMKKMNVNRTPDLILKAINEGYFIPN